MSGARASGGSFNPRLIGGVVAIGIVAFIALWALIALGPQLSSGNDGGGHALSKAAPGYAGIADLLERTGVDVDLRRAIVRAGGDDEDGKPLVILTPTHNSRPAEVRDLLAAQNRSPALIVLPKWRAIPIPARQQKPGWVGAAIPDTPSPDLLPPEYFGDVTIASRDRGAARSTTGDVGGRAVAIPLPATSHVVEGDAIETLIAHPSGGALLARTKNRDLYILADPDLISNFAFSSRDKARAAAMLVDAIAEDADAGGIAFDLTLNGFGGGRSLLRFAFVPPFIGITLCLIAAGLLALWQAGMRFGPALKPQRAIPVSKAALIANSADLIRQAGRELDGAGAYVHGQRAAIARRLHAPAGLDNDATDAWIDRHRPPNSDPFSTLARRLPLARSTHEFLADAQALHQIRKDLLRDS